MAAVCADMAEADDLARGLLKTGVLCCWAACSNRASKDFVRCDRRSSRASGIEILSSIRMAAMASAVFCADDREREDGSVSH